MSLDFSTFDGIAWLLFKVAMFVLFVVALWKFVWTEIKK